MEARPKFKLELTPTDKIVEVVGWFTLAILWILTLWNYGSLPETIPTHFNASGQPNDYGSKGTLLMLPIIATVLFFGMTILNKYPQAFNYPTHITDANALRQYTNVTKMVRYLKLAVVLIFLFIVFKTLKTVEGAAEGLGIWFLPLTFGLVFIPMIFFGVNAFKKEKA